MQSFQSAALMWTVKLTAGEQRVSKVYKVSDEPVAATETVTFMRLE